jgi:NAD(P)-dependent dehydrogenase (short-subunit alcohol dehydrogenase family)
MSAEELFSLRGKVAAVVGGGGILAGQMAAGLARYGARVAVIDRNLDAAEARSALIRGAGCQAIAIVADATVRAELEYALQTILAEFGALDIVVNGAGGASGTPSFEIDEAEWNRVLDLNLRSTFLGCQVLGKHLVEAGRGGSIINISSASSGPPLSKVFTYGIAKAGVNQITQYLAREFAPHRVRVNAILPGFFPGGQNSRLLTIERTEKIIQHTPMGRFGEPCELIGATVFLASDKASSFVTGTILRVDGGYGAMTI